MPTKDQLEERIEELRGELREAKEENDTDAEPFHPSRGPNREGMVSDYLPARDDWLAKTILEINDDGRVAVLKQFGDIYPEVSEMQSLIDEFLYELLRGRTSVGGASREEYADIFAAMYGGNRDSDGQSVYLQALAPEDD